MGKAAYFDITFGAAGDMILAAFIDLGLPEEYLIAELKKLLLPDFGLSSKKVSKNGIAALKLEINCPDEQTARNFGAIREMINNSTLSDDIKELSIGMFSRLARAEAKIHGKEPDDVSFHEVGALDSIIDIVGIAVALCYFDIKRVLVSPIPLCGGTVDTMHGKIPAMSPAATALLKGRDFYLSSVRGELITPTAAAVIDFMAGEGVQNGERFSYDSIGIGAGSRDFDTHPNIMRIFKGDDRSGIDGAVTVIQTNIDDMNPQLYDALFNELFGCDGVLDAFIVPVIMKKTRQGSLLKVIIKKERLDKVAALIFNNTTTIGLRYHDAGRIVLEREIKKISTKYGDFSVKVAASGGKLVNVSCEYDECKAAAKERDLTVKEVMDHVNAAIQREFFDEKQ